MTIWYKFNQRLAVKIFSFQVHFIMQVGPLKQVLLFRKEQWIIPKNYLWYLAPKMLLLRCLIKICQEQISRCLNLFQNWPNYFFVFCNIASGCSTVSLSSRKRFQQNRGVKSKRIDWTRQSSIKMTMIKRNFKILFAKIVVLRDHSPNDEPEAM